MFEDLPEEVLHAPGGPGLRPGWVPVPQAIVAGWPALDPAVVERRARREDEVDDVRSLLLDHADPAAEVAPFDVFSATVPCAFEYVHVPFQ